MSNASDVNSFIKTAEANARPGAQCIVCTSPDRAAIEEACKQFNLKRSLWGQTQTDPDTKIEVPLGTQVGWERFVKEFIKVKFRYAGRDKRPLIRHLENHCGLEIH